MFTYECAGPESQGNLPSSGAQFEAGELFEELRAEAKVCGKPRLKEIYQQVADEIMAAIANLEPCQDG